MFAPPVIAMHQPADKLDMEENAAILRGIEDGGSYTKYPFAYAVRHHS